MVTPGTPEVLIQAEANFLGFIPVPVYFETGVPNEEGDLDVVGKQDADRYYGRTLLEYDWKEEDDG